MSRFYLDQIRGKRKHKQNESPSFYPKGWAYSPPTQSTLIDEIQDLSPTETPQKLMG